MLSAFSTIVRLAWDLILWCGLLLRSRISLEAENLFLRRQLALEVVTWRPPILKELRKLIQRMARENPAWSEERIANELQLKLGLPGVATHGGKVHAAIRAGSAAR